MALVPKLRNCVLRLLVTFSFPSLLEFLARLCHSGVTAHARRTLAHLWGSYPCGWTSSVLYTVTLLTSAGLLGLLNSTSFLSPFSPPWTRACTLSQGSKCGRHEGHVSCFHLSGSPFFATCCAMFPNWFLCFTTIWLPGRKTKLVILLLSLDPKFKFLNFFQNTFDPAFLSRWLAGVMQGLLTVQVHIICKNVWLTASMWHSDMLTCGTGYNASPCSPSPTVSFLGFFYDSWIFKVVYPISTLNFQKQ